MPYLEGLATERPRDEDLRRRLEEARRRTSSRGVAGGLPDPETAFDDALLLSLAQHMRAVD